MSRLRSSWLSTGPVSPWVAGTDVTAPYILCKAAGRQVTDYSSEVDGSLVWRIPGQARDPYGGRVWNCTPGLSRGIAELIT